MADNVLLEGSTSDKLLLDGTGDALLLEEASELGLVLSVGEHWTDFREYRRGQFPADWSQRLTTTSHQARVEGSICDLSHRNRFLLSGPGTRTVFTWNAPDYDTGIADQEILARVKFEGTPADRAVCCLRVANGITKSLSDSYYRGIFLIASQTLRIDKFVNGVQTVLTTGSANAKPLKAGCFYYMRFRAEGTSLSLKAWAFGDAEPGSWDLTTTDASIDNGSVGLQSVVATSSTEQWEVGFVSVSTGGLTAISESDIDEPLDEWISEPDEEVDYTIRCEYYNPDTDSVETAWYSTYSRETVYSDFPSAVPMEGLIIDPGTISSKLEADLHLGGVALSRSPIKLNNLPTSPTDPGPLDDWVRYSFAGRPIEIRAGKRWLVKPLGITPGVLNPHRRFEIVGCAVVGGLRDQAQEPQVLKDEVTIPLAPPSVLLSDKLPVYRNVGINTGFGAWSNSGYLSIPNSTSYNVGSFTIYCRVLIPSTGVAGSGTAIISRRETGATARQWYIGLYQASNADAHRIYAETWSGGAMILYVLTTKQYNLDRFIDVIFGVQSSGHCYLIVDGEIIGSGSIGATPVSATGAAVHVLRDAIGMIAVDHRIEKYVTEDEALARFSARRDADTTTISLHRGDDNTGSTVTDYAALANHGTLQGTDPTDRRWVPTYLGSADLAGLFMPFSGGTLFNAPTQPIDPVRDIFRYNDRAKNTGTSLIIRAKGLTISGGGVGYSEPATALGGAGTADFVGAADQPITYGLNPNSTPETTSIHVPELIRDELVNRNALNYETCDYESFYGLRQLLPFRGGFHYQDPPSIADFVGANIGNLGAHYLSDRDARLAVGCMLPPVNPGPYGVEPLLEFLGLPLRGVTLSPHSGYALTASATGWSLYCWVLPFRNTTDLSTSSSFTYFPTGQTIIDRVDGAGGYYLGIDGRTQKFIFGAPGITTTSTGLHFSTYTDFPIQWGKWHFLAVEQASASHGTYPNSRLMYAAYLDDDGSPVFPAAQLTDATTGAMTSVANAPIRIGHGPRGSFTGSIAYVNGTSPGAQPGPLVVAYYATRPPVGASVKYSLTLTDGTGDTALETVQARYARVEGCRWSPRVIMDLRTAVDPDLTNNRRPVPAWRTDVRYRGNYSQLVGANVAAGVSATDRIALSQQFLSEPDASKGVRDNYLNSRDVTIASPVRGAENAEPIARMLRERLSTDRRIINIERWPRETLKLGMTDEVLVYDDRFDLDEGKSLRTAHTTNNLAELLGDIGSWG